MATADLLELGRHQMLAWDPLMVPHAGELVERLAQHLLEAGRGGEAVRWLEWSRSRALLKQAQAGDSRFLELQGLQQQAQQVASQLERADPQTQERLRRRLGESRRESIRQVELLRLRYPDYDRWVSLRSSEISALQESMPTDAFLVQYFPTDDRLWLIGVDKQRVEVRSLPIPRVRLEARIDQALGEIQSLGSFDSRAELEAWLLTPLRPYWEGRRLLLLPSGKLWKPTV